MAKKKVVRKVAKKVRKKRTRSTEPVKTAVKLKKKAPPKRRKKTRADTFPQRTVIKNGTLVVEEDEQGGATLRWYLPPHGSAQKGMLGFSVGITSGDFDEVGEHVTCLITYTEITEVLSRIRTKDKKG